MDNLDMELKATRRRGHGPPKQSRFQSVLTDSPEVVEVDRPATSMAPTAAAPPPPIPAAAAASQGTTALDINWHAYIYGQPAMLPHGMRGHGTSTAGAGAGSATSAAAAGAASAAAAPLPRAGQPAMLPHGMRGTSTAGAGAGSATAAAAAAAASAAAAPLPRAVYHPSITTAAAAAAGAAEPPLLGPSHVHRLLPGPTAHGPSSRPAWADPVAIANAAAKTKSDTLSRCQEAESDLRAHLIAQRNELKAIADGEHTPASALHMISLTEAILSLKHQDRLLGAHQVQSLLELVRTSPFARSVEFIMRKQHYENAVRSITTSSGTGIGGTMVHLSQEAALLVPSRPIATTTAAGATHPPTSSLSQDMPSRSSSGVQPGRPVLTPAAANELVKKIVRGLLALGVATRFGPPRALLSTHILFFVLFFFCFQSLIPCCCPGVSSTNRDNRSSHTAPESSNKRAVYHSRRPGTYTSCVGRD